MDLFETFGVQPPVKKDPAAGPTAGSLPTADGKQSLQPPPPPKRDLFQEFGLTPPVPAAAAGKTDQLPPAAPTALVPPAAQSTPKNDFGLTGAPGQVPSAAVQPPDSAVDPTLGAQPIPPAQSRGSGLEPGTAGIATAGESSQDQSSLVGDLTAGWRQLRTTSKGVTQVLAQGLLEATPDALPGVKQRLSGFQGELADQLQQEAAKPEIPMNPAYKKFVTDFESAPSLSKSLEALGDALVADPYGFTRSFVARDIVGSGPSMAAGLAGFWFGGPVGGGAASGAGSAITELGNNITQEIMLRGGDPNVKGSFKKIWNEQKESILKATAQDAAIVGFFDGLGAMVGGKLAEMPMKGVKAKVVQWLGGTLAETAAGPAGEAAKQIAREGEVTNWIDVISEGFGEIASGGVMSGTQMILAGVKRGRAQQQLTEELLRDWYNRTVPDPNKGRILALPAPAPVAKPELPGQPAPDVIALPGPPEQIKTYTEAVNEGRTLFGFAIPGQPVQVFENYDDAEAIAAKGDFRRGKLIAVSPDSVIVRNKSLDTETLEDFAGFVETISDWRSKQVFEIWSKSAVQDPIQRNVLRSLWEELATSGKDIGRLEIAEASAKQNASIKGDPEFILNAVPAGVGITPKLENLFFIGEENASKQTSETNLPAAKVPFERTVRSQIDLDELKTWMDSKDYTLVPGGLFRAYSTFENSAAQIEATFGFADQATKEKYLTGDVPGVVIQYDFTFGRVWWKGRIDPRFVAESPGMNSYVVDRTTGKRVARGEYAQFIQQPAFRGFGRFASSIVNRQNYSSFDPTVAWAQNVLTSEQVSLVGDQSEYGQKQAKLLAEMAKLVGFDKKIVLIVPTTKTDPTTGLHVIDESTLSGPDWYILENVRNAFSSYNAYAATFNKDTHLIFMPAKTQRKIAALPEAMREAVVAETLAHEFGHLVSARAHFDMSHEQFLLLQAAHRRTLVGGSDYFQNRPELTRQFFNTDKWSYSATYEEWFANQVAQFILYRPKHVGLMGKIIGKTATTIYRAYKVVTKVPGHKQLHPGPEMETFLETFKERAKDGSYIDAATAAHQPGIDAANSKVGAGDYPMTENSVYMRELFRKSDLVLNATPQVRTNAQMTVAQLDKYNKFYKWAANLRQLAQANPHIAELQIVRELFAKAKTEASAIMIRAEDTVIKWRRLGVDRTHKLSEFMHAMNEMTYRSPAEVQAGVQRWPTRTEFELLMRQHGLVDKKNNVDVEAMEVYRDAAVFFINSLKRQEELQIQEAMRLTDPVAQQTAIKAAREMSAKLMQKPYFPQMRFGRFALTIRDANRKLIHFELFETQRELRAAGAQAAQRYAPGQINMSTVPEESMPFVGVPPWMLEKISQMPGLSPDQQEWIEQFRYMLSPSISFRKHLMRRKQYSGYSMDGVRVFASYAFHHARYYTRIKYDFGVRSAIDSLKQSGLAPTGGFDVSQRIEMTDFLERVYKEWRNPSEDWAKLRVGTALFYLGFVPKTAAVNLTQVPLATIPYLSTKFGNIQGELATMNSARRWKTYYTKASLKTLTSGEMKALGRAIEEGVIDESMAAELAATSMQGGLGFQVGKTVLGDKVRRGFTAFGESAMWMFRMAEQWNRRVTFLAAYNLAIKDTGNPHVQEMGLKYRIQFAELMQAGWVQSEALAYLTGLDAIEQTQYTYDREARPRFMQGRKSALFAFQLFVQQTLWMLWQNPGMVPRFMLYSMALAGISGMVPQEVEELAKLVARLMFGKDFNLERETKRYVQQILGGTDSPIDPDLIMHGASRYGFGLPKLAQMFGVDSLPDLDMSGSIGMHQILPISTRGISTPGREWNEVLGEQAGTAVGATFAIPLGMMKALAADDLSWTDFKRWESAMPTAMKNVTKAARLAVEGTERTRTGAETLSYDINEPSERAELLAMAMGFKARRETVYYERLNLEREMIAYWETRKAGLLDDAYKARFVYKDTEDYRAAMDAIEKHNKEAPDPKLRITGDTLKRSFHTRMKGKQQIEQNIPRYPGVRSQVDEIAPVVNTRTVK